MKTWSIRDELSFDAVVHVFDLFMPTQSFLVVQVFDCSDSCDPKDACIIYALFSLDGFMLYYDDSLQGLREYIAKRNRDPSTWLTMNFLH